jgi:hypothetical protein
LSTRSKKGQRPDLAPPAHHAEWLASLRAQTEDLIAAAEDAVAPPAQRALGRREARRIIGDAASALRQLLDSDIAVPVDPGDELDDDRRMLHEAIEASDTELARGEGIPADQALAELRGLVRTG